MAEFKFSCPSCQGTLEVSTEDVGALADCPDCGTEITIPQPPRKRRKSKVKVNPNRRRSPAVEAARDVEPEQEYYELMPEEKSLGDMCVPAAGIMVFALIITGLLAAAVSDSSRGVTSRGGRHAGMAALFRTLGDSLGYKGSFAFGGVIFGIGLIVLLVQVIRYNARAK